MDKEDVRRLSPAEQHERRRQVIRAYKRGEKKRHIALAVGRINKGDTLFVRMNLYLHPTTLSSPSSRFTPPSRSWPDYAAYPRPCP